MSFSVQVDLTHTQTVNLDNLVSNGRVDFMSGLSTESSGEQCYELLKILHQSVENKRQKKVDSKCQFLDFFFPFAESENIC